MPFRFRLKPLLKHREFKLREAQSALGMAESLKMEIQGNIDRLVERIAVERDQFEKEQQMGIETGRYLYFKNHLDILERDLLLLRSELVKAAKEVEFRKVVMIDCDKSVKVLENMETREKESYRLMQARKDQKKLDDVAVFKDYRDRPGKGGK